MKRRAVFLPGVPLQGGGDTQVQGVRAREVAEPKDYATGGEAAGWGRHCRGRGHAPTSRTCTSLKRRVWLLPPKRTRRWSNGVMEWHSRAEGPGKKVVPEPTGLSVGTWNCGVEEERRRREGGV